MTTYVYTSERRMTAYEARSVNQERVCPICGVRLARIAERELFYPWRWKPSGRVCTSCNAMYMEFGR